MGLKVYLNRITPNWSLMFSSDNRLYLFDSWTTSSNEYSKSMINHVVD